MRAPAEGPNRPRREPSSRERRMRSAGACRPRMTTSHARAPLPAAEAPAGVEVSFVMPCLNEAETIERCVRAARRCLDENGLAGEVIVADNGSTDGSPDLARAAGARVVHVPIRGVGAAIMAGVEAARGRYIIMGDSDLQHDFAACFPFV